MSYVIVTGKTVEEAVNSALIELNTTRDKVEIEVIDEGNKGFLGFIGSKEATVKVSIIENTRDILDEIFNSEPESEKSNEKSTVEKNFNRVEKSEEDKSQTVVTKEEVNLESEVVDVDLEEIIVEYMNNVLGALKLEYDLEIDRQDNSYRVNILGDEQELGIVIGKRGVTLDSIQYLLSLIVNKHTDKFIRVIVDSSGYRKKREQTLISLAEKMANKVLTTNRPVKLEPMNSHERKIIHSALQDFDGVLTHSEGRDPYRRVVIQKERKY